MEFKWVQFRCPWNWSTQQQHRTQQPIRRWHQKIRGKHHSSHHRGLPCARRCAGISSLEKSYDSMFCNLLSVLYTHLGVFSLQLFKMDIEGFEAVAMKGSMQVNFVDFFLVILLMQCSCSSTIGCPTFLLRSNQTMTGSLSKSQTFPSFLICLYRASIATQMKKIGSVAAKFSWPLYTLSFDSFMMHFEAIMLIAVTATVAWCFLFLTLSKY